MAIDRRTLAVLSSVSLSASVLLAQPASPARATAPKATPYVTAVTGAPLADVVVGGDGRAYATNPFKNQVEVLALATGALEAPILVGSQPRGLDLSPDGKTLYVANFGAAEVSVVDVATRTESRRITVPPAPDHNDRPYSIAVANNGTALLTTSEGGSGWARMLQINLATDAVSVRTDIGHGGPVSSDTRLKASRDRSRIGVAEGNSSSGTVNLYNASTDAFTAEKNLSSFVDGIALDATGAKVVVSPGTYVLDTNLVLRATIPGNHGDQGLAAVNAAGTAMYRVHAGKLEVVDLGRNLITKTLALPEDPGGGAIAISSDDTTLAILSPAGITVAKVADAVAVPPCTPPAAPAGVLAVCGAPLSDVVVKGTSYAYAANTNRNQIEVVNLATGTLEAPIPVGSRPWGMDLSPDGSRLYVANTGANDLSVVDLAQRKEITRITIPSGFSNDRPFSVAVGNDGDALVTTTFDGSGYGASLYSVDFPSGAATLRTELGPLTPASQVEASGDRSKIGIVNANDGVSLYTVATDSFGPVRTVDTWIVDLALDATGSKLLTSPSGYLLDSDLVLRATIPGGGNGVAMNGAGTRAYRAQTSGVSVVDIARGLVTRTITVPEATGPSRGALGLTSDGETLVVLTASGVSLVSATKVIAPRPYTNWNYPDGVPLDGIGGWIATANNPMATAGQLAPSYIYGRTFGFSGNASVGGAIGLVTQPEGKFAVFSVVEPGGVPRTAVVPFNWQAGQFYFPLVYQLAPGVWGAWVYDNAAARWVGIGVLSLPVAWGKLSPGTTSTAQWFGAVAKDCAAYPAADVYFYPTYGYLNGVPKLSGRGSSGVTGADCQVQNDVVDGVWSHYVLGT